MNAVVYTLRGGEFDCLSTLISIKMVQAWPLPSKCAPLFVSYMIHAGAGVIKESAGIGESSSGNVVA